MPARTNQISINALLLRVAGFGIAGLVAVGSAHAASQGADLLRLPSSAQPAPHQQASPQFVPLVKAADSDSSNDKSSSAMKHKKASRTNQATGAAGNNPGAMSEQKGNQPKSAVKND